MTLKGMIINAHDNVELQVQMPILSQPSLATLFILQLGS